MNKSIPIVLYMQMLILVWQHFFAANSTAKKKSFDTHVIFFFLGIYITAHHSIQKQISPKFQIFPCPSKSLNQVAFPLFTVDYFIILQV